MGVKEIIFYSLFNGSGKIMEREEDKTKTVHGER